MSCCKTDYRWSALRRLGKSIFWLSLFGLLLTIILASWAYDLKRKLGDHLDLALPTEGHLLSGTLSLVVLLIAPCHLLGILLWPKIVKDFTRRRNYGKNADKSLNCLLLLHALLSLLSGWLAAGACTGGAYYWDQTRRRLGQGLRKAMRRYNDNETVKARLDRLQYEIGCCGSESLIDWFFVPWENSEIYRDDADEEDDDYYYYSNNEGRELNPPRSMHNVKRGTIYQEFNDVPFSCCSTKSLQNCHHENLLKSYVDGIDIINFSKFGLTTVGCRYKLLEKANKAGLEVFVCLVLLSVYQLSMSVLSRFLQTGRLSAIRYEAKGKHFEGWLIGDEPEQCCLNGDYKNRGPKNNVREKKRKQLEKERFSYFNNQKDAKSKLDCCHDNQKIIESETDNIITDDENSELIMMEKREKNNRENKTKSKKNQTIRDDNREENNVSLFTSSTRRPSRKAPTTRPANLLYAVDPCPMYNRYRFLPAVVDNRTNCPVHGNILFRR